ncbi:SAM-dependent methyltransferase [Ancylomarina euxinus]|uniref:SAM-dependent methyltransferase n=1 Tax=Ancylomarina euxinus TaxID=2283627 RepID=A0A425Y5J0_9BACT|nr:tRNA (5-methylaminomethyl-2-thiouridine)(34)-methyltransferase MnmD [Ancylomarina euxinus]MCZ4694198.1 tRNA (5-methylaminomethyl-2-thiouridine)(34)-methyltransferase MnmD [Ancylomarina euxinus]MUP14471.1 tRNA (5-methylaminomethyl-2-thiouridine)(34)-methyltransferase MnmD [Ancylomarina euxinus]RRG23773.1 SAM-dependent methyltransferase [Ancylomarina euxinus]
MLKREIKLTEDGSHTIFIPELNEHYHSTHGAIQEAIHVYINAGLHFSDKNPICILEIGFGTGLNAYLTLVEAENNKRSIVYHSLERYPIDEEQLKVLNYPDQIDFENKDLFKKLHQVEWNRTCEISANFRLNKINGDLKKIDFKDKYDLIYFDAFAPDIQPDLWTEGIFKKLYECTNPNAILVTYCSKGIVKRALRSSGFEVKRLAGPPGKHHILRATKIENSKF